MGSEAGHYSCIQVCPLAPPVFVCVKLFGGITGWEGPCLFLGRDGHSGFLEAKEVTQTHSRKDCHVPKVSRSVSERPQSSVIGTSWSKNRILESVDREKNGYSTSWLKGSFGLPLSPWCPVTSLVAVLVPWHTQLSPKDYTVGF